MPTANSDSDSDRDRGTARLLKLCALAVPVAFGPRFPSLSPSVLHSLSLSLSDIG
jgi:hypothetical protein